MSLEMPKTLTFENGKFVLREVSTPKLRATLRKTAYWKPLENDCYETLDIGAANKFRQYSDERCQKIFKRAFQEHYSLPDFTKFPSFLSELDSHQRDGIRWALLRKRSYLAHAPGAGKTAQAILAACVCEGVGQILFIVPPSLSFNWKREIEKFSPWAGNYGDIAIVPLSSHQKEMRWDAQFIICPDSMLTKDWVYPRLLAMKKKLIAVDEASRFKESLSGRSIAFYGGMSGEKIYPGLYQSTRHVVFLDGSPMPNRPLELWAPTYALHPGSIDYKDQNDFGYRYCGARPNERGQWEFLYSSNEEELKEKLQKDFMHVVPESVLSHPERRRSILFMEDVRSLEHKTWEAKHLGNFSKNVATLGEELSRGDVARFRRELGIRKVPWIAKYVRERLQDKNESILLFAWHREVVTGLAEELESFRPGTVLGGTPNMVREKLFERFQNGDSKILILNIVAGGRGHNLQRADRVIFAETSWSNEANLQCEKRASRKGSSKDFVRCEYICSPGSLDEVVLKSVFTKEKRVERIIG